MVLPISLTSLEGLDIANVVFWVTWMYDRVTQKYDEGDAKKKGDWYVLRNPDVRCHSCSKTHATGLSVVRAFISHA